MKRAWNAAAVLLGASSAAITVLLALEHWYWKASADAQVAIIILSLYVAVVTVFAVWQEYRYARKARYAEALAYINRIFLELQTSKPNTRSADEIQRTGDIVVNQLAQAFSLITSTKCSACIKVIDEDPKAAVEAPSRPCVRTLCRDDSSPKRWVSSSQVQHWLDHNTDFHTLHARAGTPEGEYYFQNWLPCLRGYDNTSFGLYGSRAPWDSNIPFLGGFLRNAFWPLPYRSTIVVPIQPRMTGLNQRPRLSGYLCVDSRSTGAFRARYDVELMTGVAACLPPLVHSFWQSER